MAQHRHNNKFSSFKGIKISINCYSCAICIVQLNMICKASYDLYGKNNAGYTLLDLCMHLVHLHSCTDSVELLIRLMVGENDLM